MHLEQRIVAVVNDVADSTSWVLLLLVEVVPESSLSFVISFELPSLASCLLLENFTSVDSVRDDDIGEVYYVVNESPESD